MAGALLVIHLVVRLRASSVPDEAWGAGAWLTSPVVLDALQVVAALLRPDSGDTPYPGIGGLEQLDLLLGPVLFIGYSVAWI